MERWVGKTAVVTGASAGIGAIICVALANAAVRVVGIARQPERVDALQSKVSGKGTIMSRQSDVSNREEVEVSFKLVEQILWGVHILVNNAGVFYDGAITDVGSKPISEKDILATLDINLKGTILCPRQAINCMKRNGINEHVVNFNSTVGHYVPLMTILNVYSSTNHAVTGFSTALNNELAVNNNN